eukprot:scaffold5064_cov115-Isochrysis_galbana.AAC.4
MARDEILSNSVSRTARLRDCHGASPATGLLLRASVLPSGATAPSAGAVRVPALCSAAVFAASSAAVRLKTVDLYKSSTWR